MICIATGCARSGTRFLASLLGWPHEQAYTPTSHGPASREVSWLAAPYLSSEMRIIHLVRDPRYVARSILAGGWLVPSNPYGAFVQSHIGSLDVWEYWDAWNQLVEAHADVRVRLEDLDGLPENALARSVKRALPEPPGFIVARAARYGYAW